MWLFLCRAAGTADALWFGMSKMRGQGELDHSSGKRGEEAENNWCTYTNELSLSERGAYENVL